MAILRSQRSFERASFSRGALLRSRSQAPTIWCAERSTRSQLLMNRVFAMYRPYTLFFSASSPRAKASISRNRASSRSSWKGERSSLRHCVSDVPRCSFAVFLMTGTRTPRNRSPSPYSPGPVLKKRCRIAASLAFASFRKRALISCAVMGQPPGGSEEAVPAGSS